MGIQRRRRRTRSSGGSEPAPSAEVAPAQHTDGAPGGDVTSSPRPVPIGDAEASAGSAVTSAVYDPEPVPAGPVQTEPVRADPASGTAAGVDAASAEPAKIPAVPARRAAGRRRPDRKRADATDDDGGQPDAPPFRNDLYRLDSDDVHTERGLRGLVGSGSSQVSVTAAMRARDAARPSDADVAAAEANLAIVRRGWVPREDLPRPGRPDSGRAAPAGA